MEDNQTNRSRMRALLFIICQREREQVFTEQIERSWAKDKPLDPNNAMIVKVHKLYALADLVLEEEIVPEADEDVHVPRIPINIAEARAMLAMSMLADERMYAGYTNGELAVLPGGVQVEVSASPGATTAVRLGEPR
jgi:hypothetical protein